MGTRSKFIMKTKSLVGAFGLILGVPVVSAATLHNYTGGHLDGPAFGYVSAAQAAADGSLAQGFEPHLHNHGGSSGAIIDGVRVEDESEYEPGDVTIVVPLTSTTTLNSQNFYWLPQDFADAENNGTPFLGIGIEELSAGDWVGGNVTISLGSINGPGSFVMWQDGFPDPVIFADSTGDSFSLAAGSHTHFNWGFSEPGVYNIDFTITGTHVEDGPQTATGSYVFEVVPEPSTALLGTLGILALLRRKR